MFSKALFKQSCKANGLMWAIITFAVCFMLACVMLISGSGNIGDVTIGVGDTIIETEIEANMKNRALNYYKMSSDGLIKFDEFYNASLKEDSVTLMQFEAKFNAWYMQMPKLEDYTDPSKYQEALASWQSHMPTGESLTENYYLLAFSKWNEAMPKAADFTDTEAYQKALLAWNSSKPTATTVLPEASYVNALIKLETYILGTKLELANPSDYLDESFGIKTTLLTSAQNEIVGSYLIPLNPNGKFNEEYYSLNNSLPEDYDVKSIVQHFASGDSDTYLASLDRADYRTSRALNASSTFLAKNMTDEANVNLLLEALSSYGVTKEKYDGFGYNYHRIYDLACETSISFNARYNYELTQINDKKANGEYASEEEYQKAILDLNTELTKDLTGSLLANLPTEVSDGLKEVGQLDIYSLIVGSIFFKMAGLLLPIIYMIMVSNNLVSSQVDTGSMAYVLSTGTKRKEVVFTQAVYLIGSLFVMFLCTTITSCICFSQVHLSISNLSYGKLILMNLGAFIVLFAMSGINFLTSCVFDRSNRSMAIGGGLSIFFLVATILGLFGSKVIPSVVRLDALNYFNYVSLISLFDVISIIDGTLVFLWKLLILVVVGIVGYICGAIVFQKKDLPL